MKPPAQVVIVVTTAHEPASNCFEKRATGIEPGDVGDGTQLQESVVVTIVKTFAGQQSACRRWRGAGRMLLVCGDEKTSVRVRNGR